LVWPYKDCVLEGGQEKPDEKRNEVFHNEILAPDEIDRLLEPKVFTNFKRIDKDGEHELDGFKRDAERNRKRGLPENTLTDNLIVKGNNLLVLKSLLKEFGGKVKLIYIDPPYNTGSDEFQYNDNFKHSTWLTFMKNRLEVARDLLREDGVIFVQCDDNEQAYLKVLMDEILERENFISQISWERSQRTLLGQGESPIIDTTEYILCYAKDRLSYKMFKSQKMYPIERRTLQQYNKILRFEEDNKLLVNEFNDSYGNPVKIFKYNSYSLDNISWKNADERYEEIINQYIINYDQIVRLSNQQEESTFQQFLISKLDGKSLYEIQYIPSRGKRKGKLISAFYLGRDIVLFIKDYTKKVGNIIYKLDDMNNFWNRHEIPVTGIANEGGVRLRRGKKPELLLKRIIELSTEKDDLVIDFFIGTGTTCAVAHKMGRQYIGVEQLDYGGNSAVVRLKNVINGDQSGISKEINWQGGGDFVYMVLMKLNEAYFERIRDAETMDELLNIWEEMKHRSFLSYRIDPKLFDENIEEFKTLNLEEQKSLLLEMLEYNDLYVNYSEIEDAIYKVSEEDKKLNKDFYEGRKDA